jgi:hypothetical protein
MTDEALDQIVTLLFDWIQGKNKINREILHRLPESAQEILENLELSEIKEICEFAFFPAEEEGLIQTATDTDITLFTSRY